MIPTPFVRLLSCALLSLVLPPASAQVEAKVVLPLDPARTQGVWEGWGVSLCWWANVFGDRDDIADLLFTTKETSFAGETLPGLGMTIARYNAGACSWNEIDGRTMRESENIPTFRQIAGFWLDGKSADPVSKSWDWSVDTTQRAMLQKARDRGANRFELFSNSPMWWMCANENPSGRASRTEDNLPPENYDVFATYLATIAQQARERWGIVFTTVEPFNEPVSGWWFEDARQEGCYFSAKSQAAFLPHLRAALDRLGLRDMAIAASDESFYSQALSSWRSLPESVKALVNQVNVHGYEPQGPRAELHAAIAGSRKPLWNSEYGDEHADGVAMGRAIMLDFHQLRPLAWCYWQALDDGNDGGWGLLAADLEKKNVGRVNPKFFVLAQFTRHIRPGMTIVETGDEDVAVAYDAARRRVVLVLRGGEKASVKEFDLTKFSLPDGAADRWITEPKASSRYEKRADLRIERGLLRVELPPDSMQTIEITPNDSPAHPQ